MVNIALMGLYVFGVIFLIALVGIFDALDKLIEHAPASGGSAPSR
jgi:hypothetical protein